MSSLDSRTSTISHSQIEQVEFDTAAFADDTNPWIWESPSFAAHPGSGSLVEFSFPFGPGFKSILGNLIIVSDKLIPGIDLLKVEIWQDTAPFLDRYLLRLVFAGDPPGGEGIGTITAGDVTGAVLPALLIAFLPYILILILAAPLIGVITYKISKLSPGTVGLGVGVGVLVLGGLGLFLLLGNRQR